MRLHICNGCGKEKMLDERVRHWHDCHPAKFTYMVKSDKILASQMASAAQPRVQSDLALTCQACTEKPATVHYCNDCYFGNEPSR